MIARGAHGYTLIEVLVAVLVLAIGIVGIMAAQVTAQRTRQGTALMSAAVQLAGSVAERMRANRGAGAAYLALDYDAVRDGAPPVSGACYSGECAGSALAAFELDDIRRAVHAGFPGGRVVICRDGALAQRNGRLAWDCAGGEGAPVAVKIGWIERGPEADNEAVPALALLVDGVAP